MCMHVPVEDMHVPSDMTPVFMQLLTSYTKCHTDFRMHLSLHLS